MHAAHVAFRSRKKFEEESELAASCGVLPGVETEVKRSHRLGSLGSECRRRGGAAAVVLSVGEVVAVVEVGILFLVVITVSRVDSGVVSAEFCPID